MGESILFLLCARSDPMSLGVVGKGMGLQPFKQPFMVLHKPKETRCLGSK